MSAGDPAQDPAAALSALRARFDEVDDGLLALIAERLRLADEAAPLKVALGRAVVDVAREADASARRARVMADLMNDKKDAVRVADDVFQILVRASRARQERYLAMVASKAP